MTAPTKMPRVIAFGDVHLGTYKMPIREHILSALDHLALVVREEKPDIILFAGDAFRHRVPSSKDIAAFGTFLSAISSVCEVIMIPGNHDIAGNATTLDVFQGYEGVRVVSIPLVIKRGRVNYICVPWLPSKALSSWGSELLPDKASTEGIIDALLQMLLMQCGDGPKILLAHATVLGSMMSESAPAILGNDVLWPGGWLQHFDACVFGHLHKPQELHLTRTLAFYTGSICPVSFNESMQRKSFAYFDNAWLAAQDFPDSCSPLFMQVPSTIAGHLDEEKIGNRPLFLQIKRETGDPEFNESDLPSATVWYEVIDIPERKEARSRVSSEDLGKSAADALPVWLEMYEPDEKDRALELATKLLDEEPV